MHITTKTVTKNQIIKQVNGFNYLGYQVYLKIIMWRKIHKIDKNNLKIKRGKKLQFVQDDEGTSFLIWTRSLDNNIKRWNDTAEMCLLRCVSL